MREAPAIAIIEAAARARARRCRPTTPRRARRAQAHLRQPRSRYCENELRRAGRRRRAGARHRVERVPRARLRADEASCMKAPVIFDGRNIYEPEQMEALGFTLLLDWAVSRGDRARHRRCRLHRQPRGARRCARAGHDVVVYDDLSAGHRERRATPCDRRVPGQRDARRGRHPRHGAARARRCREHGVDGRHALRRVAVGGRVGRAIRSGTTATTSRGARPCSTPMAAPA